MYNITALRRVTHTHDPHFLNLSFEQLAKTLTKPRDGIKTSKYSTIPAWSPASFRGGLCSEHVTHISCMVYDIDDGLMFEEHENFHHWQYIAYTSPSNTWAHHKWRLVIPFEEPIPAKYWKWVWQFMSRQFQKYTNSLLNGGKIDESCKDPRRFYFFGKKNEFFQSHINNTGYNYWVNMPEIIAQKEQEEADKKRFLAEQAKKLRQMTNRPIRNRDAYQELKMNLNLNPSYRETLASRLGAKITGGANPRAIGWRCPTCNRDDATFFYINTGTNKLSAFCNHRNSCSMTGISLYELGCVRGIF